MKCPKCQFDNEKDSKYCNKCGNQLSLICSECGKINSPDSKFCSKCGRELEGTDQQNRKAHEIEGERKYVTVLFSDMSGYTAMSEKLDPEDVKEVTSCIFDDISKIVRKYEGFIEKFIGDAIMALFGVPESHEDDPVRAIKAAREIHEIVANISPTLEEKINKSLSMHTGVNTGLVVTGEVDLEKGTHGVAGDTINLASRLSGLANPGEIIVSLDTYRQAEGYFSFQDLGPTVIKGKDESVQLYKVVSSKEIPVKVHRISGLRSNLIGRKVEMLRLAEAAEQLVKGKGTIFTICGDPGTGKSRLVEEFKSTLDLNTIQWREGHTYPYCQGISYFPIINLMSRAFRIKEGDPSEKIKDKVYKGIDYLVGEHTDITPYIGSLFSLRQPEIDEVSPEFWKVQLQKAIREILLALVLQGPTITCFEDLHWADPSSIELIHYLLSEFNYPALFLFTYRPPFNLFTHNQVRSIGESYNEITLQDLSGPEAQGMVESLLESKTIPEELQQFVQNKLEGNPFYLEEAINSLIESDLLVRDNGNWKLSRPISEQDIPSTVHGVLTSRFDRLERDMRRVLQEASVIGRAFLYDILNRISDLRDLCQGCLRDLEQLDLIRTKSITPDIEYIFKHALTQEVVYNGLLKKERKILHEKIGSAMEQLFHDRLPEFYESLAFHFTKSNSVHKAVDYLVKSGEKSLRRYALEESNQYFQKAFDILNEIPDKSMNEKQMLIDLIIRWVFVFYYIGDAYKWAEILSSHEHIAETLDDRETLGMFYAWYGFALTCRDKPNEAYQYLLKSLKIGEEISNQKVIGYASCWLSWTCARLGFLEEAINYGKKAQEISKLFKEDHYLFFKSLAGMAFNYEFTGNIRNIFDIGRDLLDYGKKHSNIRCLVAGYMAMGEGYLCSGKIPQALDSFKKAADVSADPMYYYWAHHYMGICYFFMEDIQEAEKILNEVDYFGIEFGQEMMGHPARTLYGGILMAKGEMSEGLKLIEKTNEEYLETNQKTMIFYSEQLLGNIFSQIAGGGGPINFKLIIKNIGFLIRYAPRAAKKAELHLNNAIRIAKEIGAKLFLAQVYYDLGLLYKAKKKNDLAKENIAGAMEIFEQCEAEELLKQAKNTLKSL